VGLLENPIEPRQKNGRKNRESLRGKGQARGLYNSRSDRRSAGPLDRNCAHGNQETPIWRSIDLGYSFPSGNSQTSLDVSTSAAYRTAGWEAATAFDSAFGGQAGALKTNRQDLQTTFAKYLNRNSYLLALSDFLHSSRQDLTLRTTLGGGYGRYLKRATNSNLSWLAGVVFVRESFDTTAGEPSDQHVEALVGLQYSLVRFNFGEFDSQLLTFPGLTDAGRIRLTTNNSLTIKLRNKFHLAFTFWDNFDSRPPENAKRNELGVSSGIGWSF
jgi:putative salt-induced outer membrane protein YdiY